MNSKKKIILYIDTMYRGGAQRVMANIANYLVDNGWDVILVNDFEPDKNVMQYQVSEKIRILYLRKELKGNKIAKNIERLIALRHIVKIESPYIILSFLGRPNKRMLISTIGLSCKKIVSVRNDPNKEYGDTKIKRKIINVLFHLADGIVFQTEGAAAYFDKKNKRKSCVILNPVDDKFYKIERKKQTRNIITLGRLEPQKNHRLLLQAYAKIANRFPDDDVIIYGEGSLKNDIERYKKEYGIDNRVKLYGNINHVEEKLASAKIFVLSSDFEGLPNALMEAMAVGVPCVATDCPSGGPRMLINNNEQGILVPCNDIDKMAEAMSKLLSDKESEIMGKAAKRRAQIFRSGYILKQWEDFLAK